MSEVLRRVLKPDGSVAITGKDVPFGYGQDPDIIAEKIDAEERKQYKRLDEKDLANKDFWMRYNNNASFKTFIDKQWTSLYRRIGVKVMRENGVPESEIQRMIGGGKIGRK